MQLKSMLDIKDQEKKCQEISQTRTIPSIDFDTSFEDILTLDSTAPLQCLIILLDS